MRCGRGRRSRAGTSPTRTHGTSRWGASTGTRPPTTPGGRAGACRRPRSGWRRTLATNPRTELCFPLIVRPSGAFDEPGGIRSSSPSASLRGAATPPWTPLSSSGHGGLLWCLQDLVERATARPGPADLADEGLHHLGRKFLAVGGPDGPGDVLVHEGAAEVVAARVQGELRAGHAHLHPGHLDVGDPRMQGEAGDGMDLQRLLERRPLAGLALEVDRGPHVHEGKRHELGEAAGLLLDVAQHTEVAGPRP